MNALFGRKLVLGAVALAAIAGTSAVVSDPAAAQTACKARLEGVGTGQGILGAGTQNARIAAVAAWEKAAGKRFGARYAKFDKAKDAREACQSGTLQAKCVITARPCR